MGASSFCKHISQSIATKSDMTDNQAFRDKEKEKRYFSSEKVPLFDAQSTAFPLENYRFRAYRAADVKIKSMAAILTDSDHSFKHFSFVLT